MDENFLSKLESFRSALDSAQKHKVESTANSRANSRGIDPKYDFREKRSAYYASSIEGSYNELKRAALGLAKTSNSHDAIINILILIKELDKVKKEKEKALQMLEKIEQLSKKVAVSSAIASAKQSSNAENDIKLRLPYIPEDIKSNMIADIKEIEKGFNAGLYRSSVILCGRVIEAALHRKYYEATKLDILEKNPGIGLGNLIAKLKEKNIEMDPALTQQIHLINNVRVFSVHIKKEAFMPSKEQAHAIILYTMDSLSKMWQK